MLCGARGALEISHLPSGYLRFYSQDAQDKVEPPPTPLLYPQLLPSAAILKSTLILDGRNQALSCPLSTIPSKKLPASGD